MTKILTRITLALLPLLFAFGLLAASNMANAAFSPGDPGSALGSVTTSATRLGAATQDPFELIGKVINYALGLLGIVFFGMVLYAGWKWMTAGGDSDKIKDAQKLILNGIVGMLISLSAAAISNFVVSKLVEAT